MVPSGFLQISRGSKAKIIQDKKPDRQCHVGWPTPHKGKFLWKTTTKIKVSFAEKKVVSFKGSFAFQRKCCILKKVSY